MDSLPENSFLSPPPKDTIKISVVIPAFNEERHIEKTLTSLTNTHYPKEQFEIIVVDNGSTDGTATIAKNYADKFIDLPDANVGAVRNCGAHNAFGDILIFLDADCTVGTNWLREASELVNKNPGTAFGGICDSPKSANWVERLWLLDSPNRHQRDLAGACIIISRDVFEGVGGFNELITSGEDTELSNKLRKSSYKVEIEQNLRVIHWGNAKTIREFFIRQAWHGENYLQDTRSSLADPTFLLCLSFLAAATWLTVSAALTQNIASSAACLLLLTIIVVIFSTKRLVYAKYKPKSVQEMLGIFLLDLTYIIGRCSGIFKSLYRLFNKPN